MGLNRIRIGRTKKGSLFWKVRETHAVCYAKSAGGKSVLIANGVEADTYSGHTQIVLDPSVELAEDCYGIMEGNAYYLSLDTPISLNLMRLPYRHNVISSIACECINQTIAALTPNNPLTSKMTNIFREEVTNSLEHGQFSLLSVRDRIDKRKGDTETRDGILTRLNFILDDERMNRILCGKDSVNIGELIKRGKSLIISCHRMTREQRVFLGTLTTQLVAAYMDYEATVDNNAASFWIDEAHLFVRESFLDVLKRIRKYHVSVFMATQDMASLSEKINRVMLNVGTIIGFRVAAVEASHLAREIGCTPQEIQFLENYHFAYLTGNERGFAKALRPPLVTKIIPKKVEPPRKAQRGWFPLEPYTAA